jgi:hypothetical protein
MPRIRRDVTKCALKILAKPVVHHQLRVVLHVNVRAIGHGYLSTIPDGHQNLVKFGLVKAT